MDELLEAAKKHLRAGNPEKALSILKQCNSEKLEYSQLTTACRNMLSEQYTYIIREKLNKNQLSEAQETILQYRNNLGDDTILRSFIAQAEQKETVNNGLLNRISSIPLAKVANPMIALFVTLVFIFIGWGYFFEDMDYRSFLLSGSVAGVSIQIVSFMLYLSLAKNAIWLISKRQKVIRLFTIGFSFVILSQILEFYSIVSYEDYLISACSVWNLGVALKLGFEYWIGVELTDFFPVLVVGLLNIATLTLYMTAFLLISNWGNEKYVYLCRTAVLFLSFQLVPFIIPASDDWGVVLAIIMLTAFLLWCRFIIMLRKTDRKSVV